MIEAADSGAVTGGTAPGGPDYVAFGLELFRRVADAAPGENVVVSPLSAALALGLLANGATGDTLAGILHALAAGMELDALNAANAGLATALEAGDVELAVASSIFARHGVPVLPAFVERARRLYGAEAAAVDFSSAEGVRRINGWVADSTGGRIREMVQPLINPLVILFLFSAVYFKGRWQHEFHPDATRPRTFHAPSGPVERPMMSRSGRCRYLRGDGFQALRLPYRGDRIAMYVLLPDAGQPLAELRGRLSADAWGSWMNGFRKAKVDVVMPRWRMGLESLLNDPLRGMGMEDAFTAGRAALDAMLPAEFVAREEPYVSQVLQKVFVEVNEEGTEAAAAVKVEIKMRSMERLSTEFTVDRPFVFVIRDDASGALLFVGQVNDPVTE